MKRIILFLIGINFLFTSCNKSDEVVSIIPARFGVEIPDALSYGELQNAKIDQNTLNGNVIYANLRAFIKLGEASSQTIAHIITGIRRYGIDKAMEVKFRSDWDNRTKFIKVEENVSAENQIWEYGLNAWDSQDSVLAFQLFWNTAPVKGIAIMKIFDMNHQLGEYFRDWMYKIEYSEAETNYERQMIVSVTRPDNNAQDKWFINSLKMFAGKKGDEVTVYGNTNHPNIWLVDQSFSGGRNYAFVGKASTKNEVGVAAVALPPSSVNSNTGLFDSYPIKDVIKEEIESNFDIIIESGGVIDQLYQGYFTNTTAPGYFKKSEGFVSCGSNIPNLTGFTQEFIDLSILKPFVPSVVRDLSIDFN